MKVEKWEKSILRKRNHVSKKDRKEKTGKR